MESRAGTLPSKIARNYKKDPLMNLQVTYITPESPDELTKHYDALQFLSAFLPRDVEYKTREFISNYAGYTTMVYSGKIPIGFFVLYPVDDDICEIHGTYRQDLKLLIGRASAKAVMDGIFSTILCTAFMDAGCRKVIASVSQEAKLARVWLKRFGFALVPSEESRRTYWELSRNEYLGIVEI